MRRRINGRFVKTRRLCALELAIQNVGLTKRQFAERLGVSMSTVAQWYIGRQAPRLEQCIVAAKVLGITVDGLIPLLLDAGLTVRMEPYAPGERDRGSKGMSRKVQAERKRLRAEGSQPVS